MLKQHILEFLEFIMILVLLALHGFILFIMLGVPYICIMELFAWLNAPDALGLKHHFLASAITFIVYYLGVLSFYKRKFNLAKSRENLSNKEQSHA